MFILVSIRLEDKMISEEVHCQFIRKYVCKKDVFLGCHCGWSANIIIIFQCVEDMVQSHVKSIFGGS